MDGVACSDGVGGGLNGRRSGCSGRVPVPVLAYGRAALISLTTDDRVHACRVEGDPSPTEVGGAHIVEFDLVDRDGKVLRSVQVKSGAPGTRLSARDVFTVLARLVAKGDAEKYVLLTNASIRTGVAELARILALHQ